MNLYHVNPLLTKSYNRIIVLEDLKFKTTFLCKQMHKSAL